MISCVTRLLLAAGLVGCGVLEAGAQEVVPPRAPHLALASVAAATRPEPEAPLRFGFGLGPASADAGSRAQEPLHDISAYGVLHAGPAQLHLRVSTPIARPGPIALGITLLHRF
jgi:hypothetical protein